MKTVLYTRVSTLDQTPENQILQLKEYVNNRPELEIVEIYKDKISGVKDTRPELDRLMQDARKHKFEHVIFWKVDRLGRSALHTYQVVEEWRKLGISFSITTLGIDTSIPTGRFIFGIMAQYSQLEREQIVERTNASMDRIKKSIEKKGYYITKSGKRITKLGRPRGKRDTRPRKKRGYYLRERPKKRSGRKPKDKH